MKPIEHMVEDCERNEQNVYDFDDIRFAEIYLEDKPRRKAIKHFKGEPQ